MNLVTMLLIVLLIALIIGQALFRRRIYTRAKQEEAVQDERQSPVAEAQTQPSVFHERDIHAIKK